MMAVKAGQRRQGGGGGGGNLQGRGPAGRSHGENIIVVIIYYCFGQPTQHLSPV
jgi:hypothetical protein